MSTKTSYVQGAELPPLLVVFEKEDGTVVDVTSATFTFKLGLDTTSTALTKTSGISGSTSGATVNFSAGDLDISPGNYIGELTATIGGLDYRRQFTFVITPKLA